MIVSNSILCTQYWTADEDTFFVPWKSNDIGVNKFLCHLNKHFYLSFFIYFYFYYLPFSSLNCQGLDCFVMIQSISSNPIVKNEKRRKKNVNLSIKDRMMFFLKESKGTSQSIFSKKKPKYIYGTHFPHLSTQRCCWCPFIFIRRWRKYCFLLFVVYDTNKPFNFVALFLLLSLHFEFDFSSIRIHEKYISYINIQVKPSLKWNSSY